MLLPGTRLEVRTASSDVNSLKYGSGSRVVELVQAELAVERKAKVSP